MSGQCNRFDFVLLFFLCFSNHSQVSQVDLLFGSRSPPPTAGEKVMHCVCASCDLSTLFAQKRELAGRRQDDEFAGYHVFMREKRPSLVSFMVGKRGDKIDIALLDNGVRCVLELEEFVAAENFSQNLVPSHTIGKRHPDVSVLYSLWNSFSSYDGDLAVAAKDMTDRDFAVDYANVVGHNLTSTDHHVFDVSYANYRLAVACLGGTFVFNTTNGECVFAYRPARGFISAPFQLDYTSSSDVEKYFVAGSRVVRLMLRDDA